MAQRYAQPLPLLGKVCKRGYSAHVPSRCSATASRLQQPIQLPETTRPHDNTPTGYGSPGLFCSRSAPPRASWQGWQGGTRCGMLDGMLLYNRPRRRDEVADFVAAERWRLYVFAAVRLALCSRLPISISPSSAQARATADAGAELAHAGRAGTEHRGRRGQGRAQGRGRARQAEASPRADVRGGWGVSMI